MSLGLVAYGDSDDSDQDESSTSAHKAPGGPRVPAHPSARSQPDFKRPPPALFPSAASSSGLSRKTVPSTYAQLVERDQTGRIRVTAPRLEDHDSDEEQDEARQYKKPKLIPNTDASSSGLMAVLPKPEGPKKKGEASKDSSVFDEMFTKKKKETSTTETVKALGATQIRYEAEMKKAELLRKYMKKAPVEEPDWDDEEQEGAEQSVYYPPAEPDYLGLNARAVGNVRFAEPDTQDGEDLGWEVDESAYQTEEFALTGLEYQQQAEQPVFGPQPGAVWTANYKYQDVRDILENPRLLAPPTQPGYTSNQQVEKLIARYEPEFQEYLNMGNRIDIIDVRADDHLGDPRANVMKQLTEQEANPPPRPVSVKGKVNRTAKQKGQITYLAAQAVARETELQNEWSRNRQARQQASQKYGF